MHHFNFTWRAVIYKKNNNKTDIAFLTPSLTFHPTARIENKKANSGPIRTFDNPPIFAEVLLQGLLGGLGVQSTDEELPWSVCLCHVSKACNNITTVYNYWDYAHLRKQGETPCLPSVSSHFCDDYLAAGESLALLNAQNGDKRANGCS